MAKLCLNMIVKNEAAIIRRCLVSVADQIACYAILDTGSTDDTPSIISEFFAKRGIPGKVYSGPFKDFASARNHALNLGRCWRSKADYLLLVDADMELVGKVPEQLGASAYHVTQKAGTIAYANTRLVKMDVPAMYFGVTHEYLSVEGADTLNDIWFSDQADGANRADKYDRDIALLLADLEKHPTNGRSMFYLANTYREKGNPRMAIEWYEKRIEAGGWDEEIWYSRVMMGRCYKELGDHDKFVATMLAAYDSRRSRGEPLHDLAKFYREHNQPFSSLLFSRAGLKLDYPGDMLFVDEYVHKWGFDEEFMICAYYNPALRQRGFETLNRLTLGRKTPDHLRALAKFNSFWYVPKLGDIATSFLPFKTDFVPPDGYVAMNPSVIQHAGNLIANIRTVNYRITESGHYDMQGDTAIRTRNFVVELDQRDLHVIGLKSGHEIIWRRPEPAYDQVIGMEDVRLIPGGDSIYLSANVREQNHDGWCTQVLAKLEAGPLAKPGMNVEWWRTLVRPGERLHEKNWMPIVTVGGNTRFVYKLGEIASDTGETVKKVETAQASNFSGGSQLIPWPGGWLALVHEALYRPDNQQRYYQHRFVRFDHKFDNVWIGPPFVFHDNQIEFAAGLCWHPNNTHLVMSYGVRDREAWFATLHASEVPL